MSKFEWEKKKHGRWVWVALKKGSWDLWWVLFGRWTANPVLVFYLWQCRTSEE